MKNLVLVLLIAAAAGCVPRRCTAIRVEGAPTQTVFYAEVTHRSWWAYYTGDAWVWPFTARELSRPHAEISGFTDRRLRLGEVITGDKEPGGKRWTIERPKKGDLHR